MVEELEVAPIGSGAKVLLRLYKEIQKHEMIPTEWKHSVTISPHKDKPDCSNYRGISLLCHSSKIFSSIILQRIKGRTEEILAEAQCGFRANRSTSDQIFTLKQLAGKYKEFGRDIYVCYSNFRRHLIAFGEKDWETMRKYHRSVAGKRPFTTTL